MRRAQWTEDLDVRSIRTPVHARNDPHQPPSATSALRNRIMLIAFGISLLYCIIAISLLYQNQYFIPILSVGSIGIFVLSVFVLHDTYNK